jgi:hypothetical protein
MCDMTDALLARMRTPVNPFLVQAQSTARADGREAGLTRLDLMVILATLAFLAILVLPAWSAARSTVHRAACADNLRRIMGAAILYASDNRDHMPHPSWGDVSTHPGPDNWCYATRLPDGRVIPSVQSQIEVEPQLEFYRAGQLAPLLGAHEVLMCPLDWRQSQMDKRQLYLVRTLKLTSYNMNGAVIGYGQLPGSIGSIPSGRTYRLTAFRPDDVAMWEPDEWTPFWFNDAASRPSAQQTSRHEFGGWVARFDGAVEHLSTPAFLQMSGEGAQPRTLPNRLWCNPGSEDGM